MAGFDSSIQQAAKPKVNDGVFAQIAHDASWSVASFVANKDQPIQTAQMAEANKQVAAGAIDFSKYPHPVQDASASAAEDAVRERRILQTSFAAADNAVFT